MQLVQLRIHCGSKKSVVSVYHRVVSVCGLVFLFFDSGVCFVYLSSSDFS